MTYDTIDSVADHRCHKRKSGFNNMNAMGLYGLVHDAVKTATFILKVLFYLVCLASATAAGYIAMKF